MARKKELRKKEAANKLISEINSEEVVDGLLPIDSPNIESNWHNIKFKKSVRIKVTCTKTI